MKCAAREVKRLKKHTTEMAAWVNCRASKQATICPPIQIFNLDMNYIEKELLFAVRIQYLLLSITGI
jgi:hypothetical protein